MELKYVFHLNKNEICDLLRVPTPKQKFIYYDNVTALTDDFL